MKESKAVLVYFLAWLTSAIIWIGSFFAQFSESPIFQNGSLIFLFPAVRLLALPIGAFSFLAGFTILIKNKKYGEKSLRNIQLLSIATASLSLILGYISENYNGIIDNSILSFVGLIVLISSVANLISFLISIAVLTQKKKMNFLFLVNFFLSAFPLFWLIVFILLASVGIGSPS